MKRQGKVRPRRSRRKTPWCGTKGCTSPTWQRAGEVWCPVHGYPGLNWPGWAENKAHPPRHPNDKRRCESPYPGIERVYRCRRCKRIFSTEYAATNHDKRTGKVFA